MIRTVQASMAGVPVATLGLGVAFLVLALASLLEAVMDTVIVTAGVVRRARQGRACRAQGARPCPRHPGRTRCARYPGAGGAG